MIKYVLCFVCGVAVCLVFVCFMCNKVATGPVITSVSIDTIYIERDILPVSFVAVGKLDASKSPIEIRPDTTGKIIVIDTAISSLDKYILPEFVVSFDTVVNRDTFNLRYEFPVNLFSFDFLPHRDSLMFQQITIEHTKIQTKTNWVTTLLISTGTGVVGYFIGKGR